MKTIDSVMDQLVLTVIKNGAHDVEKMTEFAKWCLEQSIQARIAVRSAQDSDLSKTSELLVQAAHIALHKNLAALAPKLPFDEEITIEGSN